MVPVQDLHHGSPRLLQPNLDTIQEPGGRQSGGCSQSLDSEMPGYSGPSSMGSTRSDEHQFSSTFAFTGFDVTVQIDLSNIPDNWEEIVKK